MVDNPAEETICCATALAYACVLLTLGVYPPPSFLTPPLLSPQDGVVLAADTRSTSGSTVADKNCEKIHYIAPNIYCCGAGTAADTENVTGAATLHLAVARVLARDSCIFARGPVWDKYGACTQQNSVLCNVMGTCSCCMLRCTTHPLGVDDDYDGYAHPEVTHSPVTAP